MGENKVSITRLDQFYTHCKSDSSLREMIRINLTVKYFERRESTIWSDLESWGSVGKAVMIVD